MNDFDGLLGSEFGLKPQGKSAPMASSNSKGMGSSNFDLGSRSSRSSIQQDSSAFADLFSTYRSSTTDFASNSNSVNSPVYDKPVYDDDVFDGVPGLKSSSSSKVPYDDVFASGGSDAAFDDLLGGFGRSKKSEKENEKGVADFDDLLPGFGNSKPSSERCGLLCVTPS